MSANSENKDTTIRMNDDWMGGTTGRDAVTWAGDGTERDTAIWAGDVVEGGRPSRFIEMGEETTAGPAQITANHSTAGPAQTTDTVDFYGHDFLITNDVLTPRPETEQLIDLTLSLAGQPFLPGVKPEKPTLPESPIILDVGTGSGCIAITLARLLPKVTIYATDISPTALKIAQKNAARQNATITFIISHLLEKVNTMHLPTPDLIVANLPYVDKTWPWVDTEALKSDPDLALYADNHGLALIYELITQASALHIPRLILEADPCQHAVIEDFANRHHYHLAKTMGFALHLSAN